MTEYDPWTLRELVGNAIAHQDYASGRRVNVAEFPDHVVVSNEGSFIPGTLERALAPGYKPPYYRNPFLCDAMLRSGMLDQNALGIRTMFENARARRMPLPSYDFGDGTSVAVTLHNHEINPAYTAVLTALPNLPLATLLAADALQKGRHVSADQAHELVVLGIATEQDGSIALVGPAGSVERPAQQLEDNAQDLRKAVLQALAEGDRTRNELVALLAPTFNRGGDFGQRIYRALKSLESKGLVRGTGSTRARIWARV